MKLLLGLIIIMALAVIFTRLIEYKRLMPQGLRQFFHTYLEFLILGIIIGPYGLNLIGTSFLRQLDPFLILGLGWVGLFVGLQFNYRKMKIFAFPLYVISFFQALVTLAICFCFFLGLFLLMGLEIKGHLIMAGIFATIASVSAPGILSRYFGPSVTKDTLGVLVEFAGSVDDIIGFFFFGFLFCWFGYPQLPVSPVVSVMTWFLLSLALGILLAYLFSIVILERCTERELMLYLLGLLIFSSSIAHTLGLSSLFVNFVLGVSLANMTVKQETIMRQMGPLEKPIYIIFLLLAGANWRLAISLYLFIVPLYIGVRLLGKSFGIYLGTRLFPQAVRPSLGLGLALISQGATAVAMIINVILVKHLLYIDIIGSIVLLALILNELLTPWVLRSAMRDINKGLKPVAYES